MTAHHPKASELPPGPAAPTRLQTVRYVLDLPGELTRCRARFGSTFTVRLAGVGPIVVVSDQASVHRILTEEAGVFDTELSNRVMEAVIGKTSIFAISGEPHLARRRMLLPHFSGQALTRLCELTRQATLEELRHVSHPHELSGEWLRAIPRRVILRVVLGEASAASVAEVRKWLTRTVRAIDAPKWQLAGLALLPGGPAQKFDVSRLSPYWWFFARKRNALDRVVFETIADRRAQHESSGYPGDDLLGELVAFRDEAGNRLSDREIRDEISALLIPGHETTTSALAWILSHLARRPEALKRIRVEAARGQREYLKAFIRESLRLRPPIVFIGRTLRRNYELSGYRLAPGTRVAICIYLLHRCQEIYPDPESFRPERFLDATEAWHRGYSWLPFGRGPHRCLAAQFALAQMETILETIACSFDLVAEGEASQQIRPRGLIFGGGAPVERVSIRPVGIASSGVR